MNETERLRVMIVRRFTFVFGLPGFGQQSQEPAGHYDVADSQTGRETIVFSLLNINQISHSVICEFRYLATEAIAANRQEFPALS